MGSGRKGALTEPVHDTQMIPLGYVLKDVASPPPDWMNTPTLAAVHSLSGCVSRDFADYIPLWTHNGWWLYDTPDAVSAAAAELGVDRSQLSLFYYEAYHRQFNDKLGNWEPFEPESGDGFTQGVERPKSAILSGYDVVSYFAQTSPECSPLSCNGLAATMPVNRFCLFDSFSEAFSAVGEGSFKDTEPGPYRIIAVYQIRVTEG